MTGRRSLGIILKDSLWFAFSLLHYFSSQTPASCLARRIILKGKQEKYIYRQWHTWPSVCSLRQKTLGLRFWRIKQHWKRRDTWPASVLVTGLTSRRKGLAHSLEHSHATTPNYAQTRLEMPEMETSCNSTTIHRVAKKTSFTRLPAKMMLAFAGPEDPPWNRLHLPLGLSEIGWPFERAPPAPDPFLTRVTRRLEDYQLLR